jgi:hypothetical protein
VLWVSAVHRNLHGSSEGGAAYIADVPSDLGHLVGQRDFEQARGVVMEVCGYTADEALRAMAAFTRNTQMTIEDCVSMLLASPGYALRVSRPPG